MTSFYQETRYLAFGSLWNMRLYLNMQTQLSYVSCKQTVPLFANVYDPDKC